MTGSRRLTPLLLALALAGLIWAYASGAGLPSPAAAAGPAPTAAPAEGPVVDPPADHVWPPRLGQVYPDPGLRDSSGARVSLTSFRGKVLVIEPIGMDCLACIAYAGGGHPDVPAFHGMSVAEGAPSVEDRMRRLGIDPRDARLVYVHLLLFRIGRQGAPSPEEGLQWERHFGVDRKPNALVLVADPYLADRKTPFGRASFQMVPGIQVVDSDFVLRWDNGGHHPPHGMDQALAALPGLLDAVARR